MAYLWHAHTFGGAEQTDKAAHGTPYAPGPSCLSTWAALPPKSSVCLAGSLQIDQMFAAFPPDVTGNLDYKNLVHIITHGEEKD